VDTDSSINQAETLLFPFTLVAIRPSPDRLDVVLQVRNLLAAVQALQAARWGYLSAITGLDHPGVDPAAVKIQPVEEKKWNRLADPYVQNVGVFSTAQLEALYHFCQGAAILTLRVKVPQAQPALPSLCALIPYAILYERELAEMLGFEIDGISPGQHFILPEDWPDGVYPLRKDFQGFEVGEFGGGSS
jgi:NADH:ubiquinone oxidoreductase subunit C